MSNNNATITISDSTLAQLTLVHHVFRELLAEQNNTLMHIETPELLLALIDNTIYSRYNNDGQFDIVAWSDDLTNMESNTLIDIRQESNVISTVIDDVLNSVESLYDNDQLSDMVFNLKSLLEDEHPEFVRAMLLCYSNMSDDNNIIYDKDELNDLFIDQFDNLVFLRGKDLEMAYGPLTIATSHALTR